MTFKVAYPKSAGRVLNVMRPAWRWCGFCLYYR
jgi:hypothetical protein